MDYSEVMEWVTKVFEAVGVAIIAIGGAAAFITAAIQRAQRSTTYYDDVRQLFGRPLLLGLEVLVAADIIETVTVDLSLESVGTLALLVFVRVVLSFALEIELDGVLPWRKAELEWKQAEGRRTTNE